jgi:hypothetical protein
VKKRHREACLFETIHPLLAFGVVVALGAPLFAVFGLRMRPLLIDVPPPATREMRPSAQSIAPSLVRSRDRARTTTRAAIALASHVGSWTLPLLLASIPSMVIAQSTSLAAVTACQSSLWFLIPQPLAFGIYLTALGLGVRAAPAIELVPPTMRMAIRCALLLALGIVGGVLFLGGENGEALPAWAWLLVKGGVVAFLAHRIGRLALEEDPATIRRLGWTVALPLAVLNLAALLAFVWLEGYGS